MRITVRNNNALKAYKVLKKKLERDGFFNELKERQFYIPKGEKRRRALNSAVYRHKKEQVKRELEFEAAEVNALIDSKKRARKFKQERKAKK